jgi:hypothetical protein
MIRPLRRVLSLARGRGSHTATDRQGGRLAATHSADDPSRRIEEARRRLKAAIPPPED